MPAGPHVQVGFRTARKLIQHAGFLDDLDCGRIDHFIPCRGCIPVRTRLAIDPLQVFPVQLDLELQFRIHARLGQNDVLIWLRDVQLGLVEESAIFRLDDQLVKLRLRRHAANWSLVLPDISLDVFHAKLARHRDSVITVLHEIGFADLV